jgi:hypothetical protein
MLVLTTHRGIEVISGDGIKAKGQRLQTWKQSKRLNSGSHALLDRHGTHYESGLTCPHLLLPLVPHAIGHRLSTRVWERSEDVVECGMWGF